jgi:hypothetical protein
MNSSAPLGHAGDSTDIDNNERMEYSGGLVKSKVLLLFHFLNVMPVGSKEQPLPEFRKNEEVSDQAK